MIDNWEKKGSRRSKITIITNRTREKAVAFEKEIVALLSRLEADYEIHDLPEAEYYEDKDKKISEYSESYWPSWPTLLITLGGDGTILDVSRRIILEKIDGHSLGLFFNIPFPNEKYPEKVGCRIHDMPVDFNPSEILAFIEQFALIKDQTKTYELYEDLNHPIFNDWYREDVYILEAGNLSGRTFWNAINDIVFKPEDGGCGLFEVEARDFHLKSQADGVLVSTGLGSSGYNASLGHSILTSREERDYIIVSLINPVDRRHSNAYLVKKSNSKFKIKVSCSNKKSIATVDGRRSSYVLKKNEKVAFWGYEDSLDFFVSR